MRERLLEWLVCPLCSEKLKLEICQQEKKEIIEGTLQCLCGQNFPIICGVPRMLHGTLRKSLLRKYPNYFHRYTGLLDETLISEGVLKMSSGSGATKYWLKAEKVMPKEKDNKFLITSVVFAVTFIIVMFIFFAFV